MANPTPTPKPSSNLIKGAGGSGSSLIGGAKSGTSGLVTGVKAATPKAPSAPKKKEQSPLDAVLSFGQSVLDIVSMPVYAVEGFLNESIKQDKAGGTQDLLKRLGAAGDNATAWTRGEKTITGSDLLTTGGVVGAKGSGAPIETGTPAAFIAGLATDIALDPLLFVPGKFITTPAKLAVNTARGAIKGGALAAEKIVAKEVATATSGLSGKPLKKLEATATITPLSNKPDKLFAIGRKYTAADNAAGVKYREATEAIKPYQTVKLEQPRSITTAVNQVVASSLEAGATAWKNTLISENAKDFIQKWSAKEAKAVRRAGKAAGATIEGNVAKTAVGAVAKVPREDGTVFEFPKFTPYQADNGKVYVSDNSAMYSFKTVEDANVWVRERGQVVQDAISGSAPVIDNISGGIPAQILKSLPTTTAEAKIAQKTLDAIEKIAREATATAGTGKAKQSVTYTGFDNLVAGIKGGDSVDVPTLTRILDALDPEKQWSRDTSKLGVKKAYEFITELLTTTGVQTAAKIQQRIDLMNAETLLKAQGVANADVAASYVKNKLDPSVENAADAVEGATVDAIMEASRSASARRLNDARLNQESRFLRVTNNINRAFQGRFSDLNSIESQKNFWEGISTLGDLTARTTELAFQASSRALLKLQLNQSFEAKMIGSILGLVSYRESKSLAKLADAGKPAIEATPKLRMLEFIEDMKLAHDTLISTLGARIVQSKNVKDPEFVKRFAAGDRSSKDPHFAFLHLGDVMEAFEATGKGKLMQEAFFPVGEGIVRRTDSLSTIGVSQAVRHLLEMAEKNLPIKKEDLVKRIISRGADQAVPSTEFAGRIEKLAEQIADHMLKNTKVSSMLGTTHKTRLLAAADESINSAETLTEDLFNNLLEGWQVNFGKGFVDDASRIRQVRELFARFVYLSGTFKEQGTEVAESVLRAAAMLYLNGGKLAKLIETKNYAPEELALITQEHNEFLKAVNNMFKVDGPNSLSNGIGRASLPKSTPAQIEKLTGRLAEAEIRYETLRRELAGITNKADYATWKKSFDKAQTALDKARVAAWKYSVPTRNWTRNGWIASEKFDPELEMQFAIEAGARTLTLEDGVINISEIMADTASSVTPVKSTAATEKKIYAEWVEKNREMQMAMRATDAEEVASDVLSREAEFVDLLPNEADQAQRMIQEYNSEVMHRGETKITRAQIKEAGTPAKFVGQGVYGKASSTRLSEGAARTRTQRAAERINAPSGRFMSYPYLVKAQSELNTAVQSAAHYIETLIEKYSKTLKDEEFYKAFQFALGGGKVPVGASAQIAELSADLQQMLSAFFGKEGSIAAAGLDGKSLQAALERFGLGGIGLPDVRDWGADKLPSLIDFVPFAPKPSVRKGATNIDIERWKAGKEAFDASGQNPFLTMSRMIQAIEYAKMEKHFVQTWSNEFSYLAEGLSYAEAVKRGYVTIELIGGVTDLSKHLPKPPAGGLYHPDLAKEFASVNREINQLYNSKRMPEYVNTMMEVMGAIKATQTIFAPRHHVTNFVGDVSTAVLSGATDVRQWAKAYQLSGKWAVDRAEVDYKFFADARGKSKLDLSLARALRSMQGKPNKLMAQEGEDLIANAVVNGKKIGYDDATLLQKFEQWAIVVGNQIISDQRSLQESVQSAAAAGSKGEMLRTVNARLNKGLSKIERPAADLAAAYGNGPRIATALKIMQKQSWKSEDEMFAAMSREVQTLHPTIYSLSATERKYPRLLFSYYTWIRGAHNALIHMAINHTNSLTLFSKGQYQAAVQAGFEPTSFGNPYEDKSSTPGYINYSTYGPTAMGPNGPMLYKPAILPLDVMDTWNIQYDPTRSFEGNVIASLQSVGQGTIGKNINFLLQPGLELLTRTDPSTGKPSQIKDLPSLMDKGISMIGYSSLAKGLGLYTPSNKGPEAANPLTQRQRDLMLSNWLGLTMKAQDVNTEANVRNAASELMQRYNRSIEGK